MYRCWACCIPGCYKDIRDDHPSMGASAAAASWIWPTLTQIPHSSSGLESDAKAKRKFSETQQSALDKITGETEDTPFSYDYITKHHLTLHHLAEAKIGFGDLVKFGEIDNWAEFCGLVTNKEDLVLHGTLYPIQDISKQYNVTYPQMRRDIELDAETISRLPRITSRSMQQLGFGASTLVEELRNNPREMTRVFTQLTQKASITPLVWRDKLGLTWKHVQKLGMVANPRLMQIYHSGPRTLRTHINLPST